MVVTLTSETFDSEIYDSTKPVLVEFWAERCPACRAMKPVLQALSEKTAEAKLCLLNVDDEPALAQRFSVKSIPTVILFHRGEEQSRRIGACSLGELNTLLGTALTH